MLQGKNMIVAVTGSIAAYKSVLLVRTLIREGCNVQVIMTPAAKAFVSPLTFATLSKRPVFSDIIDEDQWHSHVDLGLWADAMVIAPVTANTLAKCASGLADNLLVATYLSARCPVFMAPAMDLDMWDHSSTKRNLAQLEADGVGILSVGHGELASGLVGDGRMAEPEEIVEFLKNHIAADQSLVGRHVLVTAGPTYEPIDPVRFIGNPSTGKMGIAIAEAFARRGARVTLVLGPVSLTPPPQVKVVAVKTAQEMYEASVRIFPETDIAVFAAAVADYTPARPSATKIKKDEGPETLELNRTRDIALELGSMKQEGQITVGFALETEQGDLHAREKLERKRFDFIVLNSLEDKGAGFGHDTNQVKFLYPDNNVRTFGLKSKRAVAEDICEAVHALMHL
jgi:phosphopantothenoylcysteine decarboxylase/phosphopantothenate--cysteine ligase